MEQVNIVNLIVVALVMAVAAGIPALLPHLPVPGVVLDIVLGAVVGPQVLGLVHPGAPLNFLANLGLGMLFLMAGFEVDPAVLRGRPIRNAAVSWGISAVFAFGAAMLLFEAGLARAPILTALALATTAIGALMPMLRDARLLGLPYGPMVLAGGAIGEAAPVIALSLVLAGSARALPQALIMLAFAGGAFAAVVLAARASSGRFATIVERTMGSSGQLPTRLTIVVLILLAVLSEQLAIDLVLGGFVAGAIVRASLTDHSREAMATRLDGVGSAFLVPIFFITSGVRLDVGALFSDPIALAMVPIYAVLMFVTRGLPTLLLYRADLNPRQCIGLALHMATQISVVVAITSIAVHRGLMPGAQGAALVGGGILTTILYPAIARRFLQEEPAHTAPLSAG
jgi:Kef-type K+ transport system membrane component KefB